MLITKQSMMSNKLRTMDIDVTQEQLDAWIQGKGLIQNIMPNLSADEREFLMTGITPDEWDATYQDEDETELFDDDGDAF